MDTAIIIESLSTIVVTITMVITGGITGLTITETDRITTEIDLITTIEEVAITMVLIALIVKASIEITVTIGVITDVVIKNTEEIIGITTIIHLTEQTDTVIVQPEV